MALKMNKSLFLFSMLICSFSASAHQPVMDMAPRWSEGFGFQVRYENFGSDDLMDGDSEISNPLGLKRYVKTLWLEGVYTFDRSIRATFKLPYIDQSRTKNIAGVGVRQSNSGIGDLVIGLPLKHYRNKRAFTDKRIHKISTLQSIWERIRLNGSREITRRSWGGRVGGIAVEGRGFFGSSHDYS